MLAYPGKKLIFPVQQLDKQGFVQAGLWVRLPHCSQNRTGFCAEKFDVEVKHHCSILANPLILWFKMVSLVFHWKLNCAFLLTLQVRFLRWMTFSRMVIYFSWKLTAFQKFHFFDVTVALLKESKHSSKETHLIKKPCFQKNMLLVHTWTFLLLAFSFHAGYSTTYSPTAYEQNQ